jgi:hypothetical protein
MRGEDRSSPATIPRTEIRKSSDRANQHCWSARALAGAKGVRSGPGRPGCPTPGAVARRIVRRWYRGDLPHPVLRALGPRSGRIGSRALRLRQPVGGVAPAVRAYGLDDFERPSSGEPIAGTDLGDAAEIALREGPTAALDDARIVRPVLLIDIHRRQQPPDEPDAVLLEAARAAARVAPYTGTGRRLPREFFDSGRSTHAGPTRPLGDRWGARAGRRTDRVRIAVIEGELGPGDYLNPRRIDSESIAFHRRGSALPGGER